LTRRGARGLLELCRRRSGSASSERLRQSRCRRAGPLRPVTLRPRLSAGFAFSNSWHAARIVPFRAGQTIQRLEAETAPKCWHKSSECRRRWHCAGRGRRAAGAPRRLVNKSRRWPRGAHRSMRIRAIIFEFDDCSIPYASPPLKTRWPAVPGVGAHNICGYAGAVMNKRRKPVVALGVGFADTIRLRIDKAIK